MELALEVNNPCDREGTFIKAVVEQILHKEPLGHAIRYWWNPLCARSVWTNKLCSWRLCHKHLLMSGFISFACKTWKQCEAEAPQQMCPYVISPNICRNEYIVRFFLFILLARLPHKSSPSNCASFYCLPWPLARHRGGELGLTKWPFFILTS